MIRFNVFENGAPAKSVDLDSAYLLGPDNVPMRGDFHFANGQITCETPLRGPIALALMWPTKDFGRIMLETTRLMPRPKPYNLHLELARGRLVRISQKREDWGLFDFPEGEALYAEIDQARAHLVEALTAPDDATAAGRGEEALSASVAAGSHLAIFHADVFLKRRRAANQFGRRPFGCCLGASAQSKGNAGAADNESLIRKLTADVHFFVLPFTWSTLEPREGKNDWTSVKDLVSLLGRHKIHIRGTSIVSFKRSNLPGWATRRQKDLARIDASMTRHVRRVLTQFGAGVQTWEVISGINAHNDVHFTFEQLMDLTRSAVLLAKELAPRAAAIIGITLPWGEYYSRDQKTIPPLLYADMVVRNGINFDAFGLELAFGRGEREVFTRDPMQISTMLDTFGNLGKPLHLTVVGLAPPQSGPHPADPTPRENAHAAFLRTIYRVALSKPFVESVAWRPPPDPSPNAPFLGLLRPDLSPTAALDQIRSLRRELVGDATRHTRHHR